MNSASASVDSEPDLPIIDFSRLSLNVDDDSLTNDHYLEMGDILIKEFSSTGFLYLSKTGIEEDLIDGAFRESLKFFQLPKKRKKDFRFKDKTGEICGWTGVGEEKFYGQKHPDIKETFDICLDFKGPQYFPPELPGLENSLKKLFEESGRLSHRLLRCLAAGLRLDDQMYFCHCHTLTEEDLQRKWKEKGKSKREKSEELTVVLRSLHYPSVCPGSVTEGQQRLSEHTDYGTFTLLYQDNTGGLEVMAKDGRRVQARPIPGSILVNIADLLQRWTSDRLPSTPHRINLDRREGARARQSIAFCTPRL